MSSPRITMIAAIAENGIIGRDNDMPWRIKEDSAHFFRTTRKGTLVLGRKTYDSFGGKPLPGRPHVIVSRSLSPGPVAGFENVEVADSLDAALDRARAIGKEIFIAGGAEIYRLAMPVADRLVISYIEGEYEGDTCFPEISESDWTVASRDPREGFEIVEYVRS